MKNRQGLTIAALIVAIVGLSIGFAAFSNTLTISSSASVNPDDSAMNVVWSSSSSSAEANAIVPTLQPNNVTNFTSTNASITGEDFRTLNNVSANFTAPGQSVTYNLHVYNAGSYTAYLTNLLMGSKTCAAIEQQNASDTATDTLVQDACRGISISVTVGTETLTSSGSLNNQALAPNASVAAQVVITYATGSSYVDGPMSVTFGNITFDASTVQASQQQSDPESPSQNADISGSYNLYFGDNPTTQISLNNDGTGYIVYQSNNVNITYEYSNGKVIANVFGQSQEFDSYLLEGNKVFVLIDSVWTTNGSVGLQTPLEGFTYSGASSLSFGSNGTVTSGEGEGTYFVIGNKLFMDINGTPYMYIISQDYSFFETEGGGSVYTKQN